MIETKCPYCKNVIEPLDKHAATIMSDKPIKTQTNEIIPMQTVTCILTRVYIVEAKRPGDE